MHRRAYEGHLTPRTLRHSSLLETILLLAILGFPAAARHTYPPGDVARVHVRSHTNGNVEFSVYFGRDVPALDAFARSTLRCDWVSESDWTGTCRKLLRTDGSRAEGRLSLAPLVWMLHAEGAREVRITVDGAGQPDTGAFGAWQKVTTGGGRWYRAKYEYYVFVSHGVQEFPPDFTVDMGEPWNPARAATPIVFVLFGPALVALWLRRRDERRGTAGSAVVRLSWMLTGTFLYWISALSLADVFGLSVRLGLANPVLILALGAASYSLPILLSTTTCTLLLSRPSDAESSAQRRRLVGTVVLQQATFVLPFGVFLSGTSMMEYSSGIAMASLPAAFVLFKGLSWWARRSRQGGFRALVSGDLFERVSAIAKTAGAQLNGVFILGNRRSAESNAFATSKGVVMLTRGLVENLTRREVDAVVAHEVGHLRGKHPSLQLWLLVAYFAIVIPLGGLVPRSGPAALLGSLPIFPIVYVLVAARVSQRHEYDADARAVALTGDPEGKIAALARLRRLSKSPVDWGGIQGSILSHPSMRQRVLALGNRFGVPPERALAILADPDIVDAGSPAPEAAPAVPRHYTLPAEVQDTAMVFTSSAKATYVQWVYWPMQAILVAILAAVAYLVQRTMPFGRNVLFLFASIPAAAWLYLRVANWFDVLFRRWLESRIRRRIPCAENAIFVGLLPGEDLRPYEIGFYEWDLGLLSLDSACLTYSGERTRFSLPRAEITGFAIRKGPLAWDRQHAVLVRHAGGAFLLKRPGSSWWRERRLEKRLTAWWRGEMWRGEIALPETAGVEALPRPDLPVLAFTSPPRWKMVWAVAKQTAVLFFGTLLALSVLMRLSGDNAIYSVLVFVVPLTYILAVLPMLFRRRRA